jgi:hypothetical protein
MADDQDYEKLLDQNVGEVKSSVRDLEDPDYEQLLQLEKDGKDRKTVKEFLEDRLDDEEETQDSVEEVDEETEEIVEEIEEETSDGLLGSFSKNTVLASGVVLGVLIGLVAGYGALGASSDMASQGEVESTVTELFTAWLHASGLDASQFEIADYTQQNGTQTNSRSYYVSPDSDLLVQTPINIADTLEQIEAQQAQQTPPTENSTE